MLHPNAYPEVKAFIEQARKEGIVEPHGREDYSLLETKDRNRNLQGLTDALQAPRDAVERMTNHWSLAYTKFYVDAAYDHLTEAQKKDVVYNQVHDFTANYSQLAKMMAFDKLGSIGHSVSNFSKWNFNRIGRYVNDLKFVANIPEVGPRALLPIMTSMMIGLTTAGLYGTIGVADYEAFRKLGQATGWWDWRPASAWITKFAPDAKENWQKRGFLQGVSDDIASTFFNEPTGPDVSSSMRESSPAELSTVTFQVLGDMIHDAGIAMKGFLSSKDVDEFMQKIPGWNKVWDSLKDNNAGKGLSSDNMKQLVNSLPTALKGPVQDTLLEPKIQPDGSIKYVVPELKRDQGMYVRDEFQRQVARATNIRTADENNAAEARSFSEWQKRQKAENLKVLKEGLEEAVMDPKMADTRRVSDNALQILQNHGEDALNAVERDLETKMAQKLQTDYMGNELMQAAKMRDAITMQKALERIEFAKKIWNQKEAK
jgi:transcriptional regulator NrdR family protein